MTTVKTGSDAIQQARAHFPALERWTYMDVAARCILSREVRAAIDAHLDQRMYDGGDKKKFFELIECARGRFAQLINAEADEVSFAKNVSEALNMIAASFPWQAGDNVILCPELEHPNNVYPWLHLKRLDVEARFVAPRDGHIPVEDIAKKIDQRTRMVTVSTVTLAPGFRTEVDALGRVCRERGVFFLVDAAQSVGILHTDVQVSNIDGLATSTQKGLLALYGMGFLYCQREWAERMQPAYLARFSVDLGEAHEAAMGEHSYKLMRGARRFDLGNYNFVATAAVDASMQYLLQLGTREIERYVVGLSHVLARGFLDLGFPVCGGPPGPQLAGIVTVGQIGAGSHYGSDDERLNRLYNHLVENRVKLSIRRGVLRFSLHVYNNLEDVERVLDLARGWLRQ